MKRIILLFSVLCLSVTVLSAKGIPIQFGEQDKTHVVYEFPQTEEFQDANGVHFNLARYHQEFSVLWLVPLWITKEPQLVLVKDGIDDEYWELKDEDIDAIVEEFKLDKEELLSLNLYTRYGGKAIGLLLIALMIWGMIPDKEAKEDEDKEIEENSIN